MDSKRVIFEKARNGKDLIIVQGTKGLVMEHKDGSRTYIADIILASWFFGIFIGMAIIFFFSHLI